MSGAGKTTVAVTVARANVTAKLFPDGVYWLTDSQVFVVYPRMCISWTLTPVFVP